MQDSSFSGAVLSLRMLRGPMYVDVVDVLNDRGRDPEIKRHNMLDELARKSEHKAMRAYA
jgi:hypothetical protein